MYQQLAATAINSCLRSQCIVQLWVVFKFILILESIFEFGYEDSLAPREALSSPSCTSLGDALAPCATVASRCERLKGQSDMDFAIGFARSTWQSAKPELVG